MVKCDKGEVEISGTKSQILAEFAVIVRALRGCDFITDEEIKKNYERGFESDEELIERAADKLADILAKIAERMKEGDESEDD